MGANQYSNSNLSHISVPNVCGVYLLRDTVTGGTYVGAARRIRTRISIHFHDMQRRPEQHTYRNMRGTFQTYGASVFQVELLEKCTPEDLLKVEKQWIEKLQPTENLYVCTDGRDVYTAATHAKKSAAAAALWKDPEYRAKAVAARKGNAYCKGYKCTPEQVSNRKRAARISNMKRNYGGHWKDEYIRRYPEHAEDVNV
jgi:group I intron endonuclease